MDNLSLPPLESYHGSTAADTITHKQKRHSKKKAKKKLKKLEKELDSYKKRLDRSKSALKAERKLNTERERRNQAEMDLKYLKMLFQFYISQTGGSLPGLPELSGSHEQEEVILP